MKKRLQKGDRALIKKMNQQLVLRLIQSRGPLPRRDIARISGLSPASVTGIVGELMDLGLVQEAGEIEQEERAGRKAILLQLNPTAGYVVGVSLAMHIFTCVLTDLDADILYSAEHKLPLSNDGNAPYNPESIVPAIIQAVEALLGEAEIEPEQLVGIGVGINGIVDYEEGVSLFAPHYQWRNVDLAGPISSHFAVPVHLENDALTLTIAEQLFGAGCDVDHFVTVAIGYGIGAGIVANGQIYRGSSGGAGEFGHIVLQENGPPCRCGRRGCLESLASVPAIFRQIEDALTAGEASVLSGTKPLTLEAVTAAADASDSVAKQAVAEAGQWLGRGMAILVNVLNPQLFVINGEAVCLGDHLLKPMEAAIREHTFNGLANSFRITTDPGGTEVWAQGVASVVLNALFNLGEFERLL